MDRNDEALVDGLGADGLAPDGLAADGRAADGFDGDAVDLDARGTTEGMVAGLGVEGLVDHANQASLAAAGRAGLAGGPTVADPSPVEAIIQPLVSPTGALNEDPNFGATTGVAAVDAADPNLSGVADADDSPGLGGAFVADGGLIGDRGVSGRVAGEPDDALLGRAAKLARAAGEPVGGVGSQYADTPAKGAVGGGPVQISDEVIGHAGLTEVPQSQIVPVGYVQAPPPGYAPVGYAPPVYAPPGYVAHGFPTPEYAPPGYVAHGFAEPEYEPVPQPGYGPPAGYPRGLSIAPPGAVGPMQAQPEVVPPGQPVGYVAEQPVGYVAGQPVAYAQPGMPVAYVAPGQPVVRQVVPGQPIAYAQPGYVQPGQPGYVAPVAAGVHHRPTGVTIIPAREGYAQAAEAANLTDADAIGEQVMVPAVDVIETAPGQGAIVAHGAAAAAAGAAAVRAEEKEVAKNAAYETEAQAEADAEAAAGITDEEPEPPTIEVKRDPLEATGRRGVALPGLIAVALAAIAAAILLNLRGVGNPAEHGVPGPETTVTETNGQTVGTETETPGPDGTVTEHVEETETVDVTATITETE